MCREKYTLIPVAAQIEKPPLKAGGRPCKTDASSLHYLRKKSSIGVRANMARRWQPRREKMRVSCGPPSVGRVTTAVIAGVNSSAWRV